MLHSLDPKLAKMTVKMWNISYNYKNVCAVQQKLSHKTRQWLHIRLFKDTSVYVDVSFNIYVTLSTCAVYTTFKWMNHFLGNR
jgi:hypothetical protein